METKLFSTSTAIALAISVGSAAAAENFTALDGVTAEVMTASEMAEVNAKALLTNTFVTCSICGGSELTIKLTSSFQTIGTDDPLFVGVKFQFGGREQGHLTGWSGNPLPRGF